MKKNNRLGRIAFLLCTMTLMASLTSCGEEKPSDNTAEAEKVDEVITSDVEASETSRDIEDATIYEFVPGDDYILTWSDEFDGDSLDKEKWSYQLGDGGDYGVSGWGNNESQIYTDAPQNVSVSDGTLKITALKEKLPSGVTGFTSGRIRTITDDNEVLFSTTFGRVEAKIMMEGGSGIWPAFWLLPVDASIYGKWAASGEIDVMEVRGRIPNVSTGTIHFGNQWPNNVYESKEYTFSEGTDVSDYHVYAVEWEPDEMRWYIDDECFYTLKDWYANSGSNATEFTYPAPFDVPFYILLNVAVGGNFDPQANLNDESFPGKMTVDYVRVYQKKDGYAEKLRVANSKGKELDDGEKEVLLSGNSIYNGSFDQGINHIGYWKMEGVDANVDPFDYTRGLHVVAIGEGVPRLYQTGLTLESSHTYGVRVDTSSAVTGSIIIRIISDDQSLISEEQHDIEPGENNIIAYKLDNTVDCKNATFEIIFEDDADLTVDNIMLMKLE